MSKLIVPAEIKVCATCSYWDGKRKVDAELGVIVVDGDVEGQCLVQHNRPLRGLNNEFEWHPGCLWEHLVPDEDSDFVRATT